MLCYNAPMSVPAGQHSPSDARTPVDLILADGFVVCMDDAYTHFKRGTVAVRDGAIVAVGPADAIAAQFAAEQTIDCRGCAVLPGLINSHTHLPMTLLRGVAEDLDLQGFLTRVWAAEAELMGPAGTRIGARLGALEAVRAGTTTALDMYFHPIAAHEGAVAREVFPEGARLVPPGNEGFERQVNAEDDGQVGIGQHVKRTVAGDGVEVGPASAVEARAIAVTVAVVREAGFDRAGIGAGVGRTDERCGEDERERRDQAKPDRRGGRGIAEGRVAVVHRGYWASLVQVVEVKRMAATSAVVPTTAVKSAGRSASSVSSRLVVEKSFSTSVKWDSMK